MRMTPGSRSLSLLVGLIGLIGVLVPACLVHTTPAEDPASDRDAPGGDGSADADAAVQPETPVAAQPEEPVAAPTAPATTDPPAQPERPRSEMKCAAAGPRLVELTRTALPRSTPARQSRLWIYKSGAWQRHVNDELVAEGCLSGPERERLERLIAAADMKPPPPPQIQCKALPTAETRVVVPPRGGAVTYSGPCGVPAHDSIYAIEQELRGSVGGGKSLFPELP